MTNNHASVADVAALRLDAGVAAQIAAQPAAVAVMQGRTATTYGDLGAQAGAIAAALQARECGPEDVVGIALPPGAMQVAAVLGVLAAGAAYSPVESSWPASRIAAVLRGVRWVITDRGSASSLSWPAWVTTLTPDALPPRDCLPAGRGTATNLAYVIHTSGTTGTPKGVMMTHAAAQTTVSSIGAIGRIGPRDRVLCLSRLSFDLSVFDIFGVLGVGGTMVIPPPSASHDARMWSELLRTAGVTIWNSVPALLQLVVETGGAETIAASRLRLVLLSGDWIPRDLPRRVEDARPGVTVLSLGGATEDGIWSVSAAASPVPDDWASIPYGQPLPGHTAAVRDGQGAACPLWVAGELMLGGEALARGYWNDPALTAARFLPDPDGEGARCYRTGDRVRWRPGPTLELLGRLDSQVKLHGYRIELEEIERAVAAHPSVSAAAARLVQGTTTPRLYAYAVAAAPLPSPAEWRTFLRRRLPEPLIPAAILPVAALPLTPTGKRDRSQLPDPPPAAPDAPVAASADLVSRLRALVADLLQIAPPDADANLLDLGANSVDIIRLANRFEEELGVKADVRDLFDLPTIDAIAAYYEDGERAGVEPLDVSASATSDDGVILDFDARDRFKKGRRGIRGDLDVPETPLPSAPAIGDGVARLFVARRTHRRFAASAVRAEDLGQLLSCLGSIDTGGDPKYWYASAGGLYPVQVYLEVKPDRVVGIRAGSYYYDPARHALRDLSAAVATGRAAHASINRRVFDAAAFSLLLIGDLNAIQPMYGSAARDFCLFEAGSMGQLLMMQAAECGLGLCGIGALRFDDLREPLRLGPEHMLLHAFLGGVPAPAEATTAPAPTGSVAAISDMLRKLEQTSIDEVRALLAARRTSV